MTNFQALTQQAVTEIKQLKAKRTYRKRTDETCHERWDREHIEKWQAQIAEAEDTIADYDSMSHEELFAALSRGNLTLAYAFKQKAKYEALIAKYLEPDRLANRAAYARSRKVVEVVAADEVVAA